MIKLLTMNERKMVEVSGCANDQEENYMEIAVQSTCKSKVENISWFWVTVDQADASVLSCILEAATLIRRSKFVFVRRKNLKSQYTALL
jgi:hypothetical protein